METGKQSIQKYYLQHFRKAVHFSLLCNTNWTILCSFSGCLCHSKRAISIKGTYDLLLSSKETHLVLWYNAAGCSKQNLVSHLSECNVVAKPEKTLSIWVCQCWTRGSCENIRWPIKNTSCGYGKNGKCCKHLWIFFYSLDIVSNSEFSLAFSYLDLGLIYCWFSIDTKDCKTFFLRPVHHLHHKNCKVEHVKMSWGLCMEVCVCTEGHYRLPRHSLQQDHTVHQTN